MGGPYLATLAEAAALGGTIFEYGGLSMQPTPFPTMSAIAKGLTLRGYSVREIRNEPALIAEAKQYVYDRLEKRRFTPKIAKTFPLTNAVAAYEYLESNAQVGKVVVTV